MYQVDEALGRLGDERHAALRRGGRGEQHELDTTGGAKAAEEGGLLQRDVGDHETWTNRY
jgi:hypothetical protein